MQLRAHAAAPHRQDLGTRPQGSERSPHTGQGCQCDQAPVWSGQTRPPGCLPPPPPLQMSRPVSVAVRLSMCVRVLHWADPKHLSVRPAASPPRERLRCGESSVQIKCPSTSLLHGLPAPLRTEIVNPVPTAHCWPLLTFPCTPGADTILIAEAPVVTGFVLPGEGHHLGVNSAAN